MSEMLHSAIDQIRTPANLAPLIRQAVRDLEAERDAAYKEGRQVGYDEGYDDGYAGAEADFDDD